MTRALTDDRCLGSDIVRGGNGDDLLIGGTTSYDDDNQSLSQILALWSAPQTLAQRVAALTVQDSPLRLSLGDTVQHDQSLDSLVGNAGADWYLQDAADLLLHGQR